MMKRLISTNFILFVLTLLACEADQGEVGPSGLNSLINIEEEANGGNCPTGGLRVEVGLDTNQNGVLDKTEVESVQFVCHNEPEASGLNSLINIGDEAVGDNCRSGGVRVESGLDANNNGVLDALEVQSVHFVCQGEIDPSGVSSLINVEEEAVGENCQTGGLRVEVGLDRDNNDLLDETEVESIRFVCNGSLEKEIRFLLGSAHSYVVEPESTHPAINESQLFLFNINNYPGIDSIVYVVTNFETESISHNTDMAGEGFLELYDMTHMQSIPNSGIRSDNADRIISDNLIESFPNEAIDIGFRIYSENDEFLTRTGNIYLILYRNP
ncbi:DUF7151 family protein [Catalinimonas niigatensis]|uniref:DUF7151 family protein n=1 Tax=Catalinimonas niigatensis TaxID=1397264 RepID=UPI002666A81B|nr:hypothetical protein [Catalinimonas niigatensis]WPP49817.1 hypothetical protein PZB72_24400 [Catalinimonas niigatensis]